MGRLLVPYPLAGRGRVLMQTEMNELYQRPYEVTHADVSFGA